MTLIEFVRKKMKTTKLPVVGISVSLKITCRAFEINVIDSMDSHMIFDKIIFYLGYYRIKPVLDGSNGEFKSRLTPD